MDMYEISATAIIFALSFGVFFLNKKRHDLEQEIEKLKIQLKRKK